MKILKLNENTLLIDFEKELSKRVHNKVMAAFFKLNNVKGINYCTPAYQSLLVGFDCDKIAREEIISKISENQTSTSTLEQNELVIPVCYDSKFALDKQLVEEQTKQSFDKVVELHTSTAYRVFMMGFLPGFGYLGKLPKEIYCQRKPQPRAKVPKGSVGLAGLQSGIYPSESPGGWQIIGRTPLDLVDFNKKDYPFLFKIGDVVRFQSISVKEFEQYYKSKQV